MQKQSLVPCFFIYHKQQEPYFHNLAASIDFFERIGYYSIETGYHYKKRRCSFWKNV